MELCRSYRIIPLSGVASAKTMIVDCCAIYDCVLCILSVINWYTAILTSNQQSSMNFIFSINDVRDTAQFTIMLDPYTNRCDILGKLAYFICSSIRWDDPNLGLNYCVSRKNLPSPLVLVEIRYYFLPKCKSQFGVGFQIRSQSCDLLFQRVVFNPY